MIASTLFRCVLVSCLVLGLGGCDAIVRKPAAPAPATAAREFGGWAAINGGGPQARATNDDWHLQNDLRLVEDGDRVNLHWRDGVATGYSLKLRHQVYAERQLDVLQLDVIEDATGKALTYVWTEHGSHALGLNLGWLQVGLRELAATPKPSAAH